MDSFSGTVRLFPLPNLVLFPHIVQPLHIFEPRYRRLMEDALAGDRMIAMALLRPGWEEDYDKAPPLYPVVCLGRITSEERLADGRFNLLLRGLARLRVLEEHNTDHPYRTARAEVLHETPMTDPARERTLRTSLGDRVATWRTATPTVTAEARRLVASDMPLGPLCDLFAYISPLPTDAKHALLEETDVEKRVRLFLAQLDSATGPADHRFPPGFSAN